MLAAAGFALTALSAVFPAAEPFRALGLGIVVIWLSVGIPRLVDAARFGDLSYGLYIVHFPIIQTAISLGFFTGSLWQGALVSVMASIVAALLLWRLVERPALRSDSAYRALH